MKSCDGKDFMETLWLFPDNEAFKVCFPCSVILSQTKKMCLTLCQKSNRDFYKLQIQRNFETSKQGWGRERQTQIRQKRKQEHLVCKSMSTAQRLHGLMAAKL